MQYKVRIEIGSVQETLVLPLFAKAWCMRRYPDLFNDRDCERIISRLDYDFSAFERKENAITTRLGALAAGTRQYAIAQEIRDYVARHPNANIVNLGCGLDTTGHQADTGQCRFYNIDFPDVIAVREQLLPSTETEQNIAADLTDFDSIDSDQSWFSKIPSVGTCGSVFFASGVFLYLDKSVVRNLLVAMAERFPGARIIFDAQNPRGARYDLKTIRKAGIDVSTKFSLKNPEVELRSWSQNFALVRSRGMSTQYLKPDRRFGLLYCTLAYVADWSRMSQLNVIDFKA